MPLTPGTRLGPYEILDLLGAGGMGEVFRATDTRLYRSVAIKILPGDQVADPERQRRFLQEARAASALNHPNIVTLYDIASDSGVDYLVMEYVPGKSLDRLIPPRGLPVREALTLAQQVAGALAAAHSAGIVHRDLKPPNVMITDSGIVKVLDFGLAKQPDPAAAVPVDAETKTILSATDSTRTGSILGTVNYMSPEQAQGKRVDPRSDIFSFGALLYEMLTGTRAFQGETFVDTLAAILRDEIGPVVSVDAQPVPARLDELVRRCLRKKPEDRWQSMSGVQTELAIIQSQPLTASALLGATSVSTVGDVPYAGFWIRGVARVIDLIIVGTATSLLRFVLFHIPLVREGQFFLGLGCIYEVYFLTTRAATIGKMVLNLKVIRPQGGSIPSRLAFGRYCALALDLVTAGVGFLMAAFDREKRTLHDRICGTRVVMEK